jgi:hypothetical protein
LAWEEWWELRSVLRFGKEEPAVNLDAGFTKWVGGGKEVDRRGR